MFLGRPATATLPGREPNSNQSISNVAGLGLFTCYINQSISINQSVTPMELIQPNDLGQMIQKMLLLFQASTSKRKKREKIPNFLSFTNFFPPFPLSM